jgi:AraC family transcriptional regulator of adaptative response / DNA-3-methyladenine glycosylase II
MTQGAERDELRVWERARLARDERFDGRFFVGVTSTGIYCRPICPAPRPKPAHVRYFASAAAAAEAGFRPCLRCRPEASPGTPAWVGAPTSVTRALKLIGESALDDGGVDELAERLGIGARHLRRLFLKHLGATPVAVAQTRRVHFAKRLIDETSLPMTQVAFAAGFGSVRRFNATFRELYGCPPRELRRNGWRRGRGEGNCYTFRLAYRPPYDWDSMLRFLAARATPGVETVEGNEYRRTIKVDGQAGWIAVRRASGNALTAEIRFPAPAKLFQIVERVRRMFDLSADPRAIAAVLRRDARLAGLVRRWPGLRVPGCWSRFELAVRAVLGQQISVRAASTLAGRLAEALGVQTPEGRLFPASEAVAAADLEGLGITGRRAQAIRELARRRSAGGLSLGRLAGPGELEGALTQIAGVGPWTAQYIAMRLGEPDAFPGTDRYLAAFAEKAEAWRPWRAYAAMYIWNEAANT